MPFKSKAQQRWMFAAEARGELPKGTADRWAKETKSIKSLPEHKGRAGDGKWSQKKGKHTAKSLHRAAIERLKERAISG